MFSQLAKTPVGYKRQSLGRLELQDLQRPHEAPNVSRSRTLQQTDTHRVTASHKLTSANSSH